MVTNPLLKNIPSKGTYDTRSQTYTSSTGEKYSMNIENARNIGAQFISPVISGSGSSRSRPKTTTTTSIQPVSTVVSESKPSLIPSLVSSGVSVSPLISKPDVTSIDKQLYSSTYGKYYVNRDEVEKLYSDTSGVKSVTNIPSYWGGQSRLNPTTNEPEVILESGLVVKYDTPDNKRVFYSEKEGWVPDNFDKNNDVVIYVKNGQTTGNTSFGNVDELKGIDVKKNSSKLSTTIKQFVTDQYNAKVRGLIGTGYVGNLAKIWDEMKSVSVGSELGDSLKQKIQQDITPKITPFTIPGMTYAPGAITSGVISPTTSQRITYEEFKKTYPTITFNDFLKIEQQRGKVIWEPLVMAESKLNQVLINTGRNIYNKFVSDEKDIPLISDDQSMNITRENMARRMEVTGSIIPTVSGVVSPFVPIVGPITSVIGGGGIKAGTGFTADYVLRGKDITHNTSKEVWSDFWTGALQGLPYGKPVTTGLNIGQKALQYGIYGYSLGEKIDMPLTEMGVSPILRRGTEEFADKLVQWGKDDLSFLNRGGMWLAEGVVRAGGQLLFSETEQEAKTGLLIGSALGPSGKVWQTISAPVTYGVLPYVGVSRFKEGLKTGRASDFIISGLSILPALNGAGVLTREVVGNLKIKDAIPGFNVNDVKRVRVTVDMPFEVNGQIKHLIYSKQSPIDSIKISESPGGGVDVPRRYITQSDILDTGIREIKEETGIDITPSQLIMFDPLNGQVETQFILTLKKPLSQNQIPTKVIEGRLVMDPTLIKNIGDWEKSYIKFPYQTPIYQGPRVLAGMMKFIGYEPGLYLRQQDVIALKRVELSKKYDTFSNSEKLKWEKKGELFFKKKFEGWKQDGMFPINIGREYYLISKGVGSKIVVGEDRKMKVGYKFHESTKTYDQLVSDYSSLGMLDKLNYEDIGGRFYIQSFPSDYLTNLNQRGINIGERYYLLTNGIGTGLEISRLKSIVKTQVSPSSIYGKEVITYKSGRQTIPIRNEFGRFETQISRYRINPMMSVEFIPHSRYSGDSSEVAKFLSKEYFSSLSLSPSQLTNVGKLKELGMIDKLNIDVKDLSDDTIIVLSKDQKTILTGKNARGEDVLFFTPPTSSGIYGSQLGALSYSGISGLVDYKGGWSLFGDRPVGYSVLSDIRRTPGVTELGFTKKGSPRGMKSVREIEIGLSPSGVLEPTGRKTKYWFGQTPLIIQEQSIIRQLNNINSNIKTEITTPQINKDIVNVRNINKKNIDNFNRQIELEQVAVQKFMRRPVSFIQTPYYPMKTKRPIKIGDESITTQSSRYYQNLISSFDKDLTNYENNIRGSLYEPVKSKITTSYDIRPQSPLKPKYSTSYNIPQTNVKVKDEINKKQLQIEKNYKKQSSSISPGYYVLGKMISTGEFKKIVSYPVSRQRALDIGSFYVDNSVARTFKITQAKDSPKTDNLINIPIGYYDLFKSKLREYKIQNRKIVDEGKQYIEKSKYLIDSPFEKSQLSFFKRKSKSI